VLLKYHAKGFRKHRIRISTVLENSGNLASNLSIFRFRGFTPPFPFFLGWILFFSQNNLFTFLSHYLFDFSPWPCPLSHVPHIWISDVMSAIKAFLLSPPFLLADFICRLDLWQHRKSLRVIEFGPKWYMHGYSLPFPWQLQLIIRNVERALKWNIHRTCDLINYFLLMVKHVKPKKKIPYLNGVYRNGFWNPDTFSKP